MASNNNDNDLRSLFAALRREDEARTPVFTVPGTVPELRSPGHEVEQAREQAFMPADKRQKGPASAAEITLRRSHQHGDRSGRSRIAPGSGLGRLVVLAASLAALVACFFLVRLMRQPEQLPRTPAVSLTKWKAPTDFLLETPGRELLRTVPAIGVWKDRGQQPKRPHTVKQLQR